MKAAVLRELGRPLVVEDIPRPEPAPGEVLVRTKACGICATDLHIHAGWGYQPALPFVMGHEPAGVVEALGDGVTGFQAGDRVIPNIFYACGQCRYCCTDRETLCAKLDGILGVLKHPGAYAECFTIPAKQLFHLPDTIPFADAAVIADAVVTAVHAVRRRSQVHAGDWVLVFGAGGVGQCVIQAARLAGALVLAADLDRAKLERAAAVGALGTMLSGTPDFLAWVKDRTHGQGVDIVYDCHGSEQTLTDGLAALAPGGRLVIIGYTQQTSPLSPQKMSRGELEIVGSRSGSRRDTLDAVTWLAAGDWHSIVSDIFPIDRINDALDLLRSAKALGRIVITMDHA